MTDRFSGIKNRTIKNVAIVSLSAGTIGEDFVRHEVEIGKKRMKEFGLNVTRYADMPLLCSKYRLFPEKEEWAGKILPKRR